MTDAVVRVENVTKRFSGHTAVRDLSLEVPRGVIFGLLGPNGAGKSTTIRMIMDIIEPDEGGVVLFGGAGKGRDLSARIGFLPEERGLYKKMKVVDHLVFLAEIKGLATRTARQKAGEWLERLGLKTGPITRSRTSPRACSRRSSSPGPCSTIPSWCSSMSPSADSIPSTARS
jgi:ABC-type uncharacterized transport system ATPase subunit